MTVLYGVAIPLEYITPNLIFYPLIFPSSILYIKFHATHEMIKLNKADHLIFVKMLMESLGRKYTIIGKFLIDLTRNDFQFIVDEQAQKISLSKYESTQSVTYCTDGFVNALIKKLKLTRVTAELTELTELAELSNEVTGNQNNIRRHCQRISLNSQKIQNYFATLGV